MKGFIICLAFTFAQASDLGEVFGVKNCGGPGKFVEWRIEGYETIDRPCQLPAAGKELRSKYSFKASRFIENLGLRYIGMTTQREIVVTKDELILSSEVEQGTVYTMETLLTLPTEWKGVSGIGQEIIYNYANNETEVCSEVEVEFV